MQIAFICSEKENFSRVYSKNVIKTLEESGSDGVCYNKAEVLENKLIFKDTEYIFSTWDMPTFTNEEIKGIFPSLKCVFYAAGSVKKFAKPFLECGVKVFSAWAANAIPVAEYTVANIILANKGFYQSSMLTKNGYYERAREFSKACPGNCGVKIGIIGAGMIGKLVINMLKAYNLQVLVFDPFLPDETANELGVQKVSLDTIFKECQVISNHLADNKETKGMLKFEHFNSMLPYATFLNTGRGAQVVENDLVTALTNRPDITAVLDVTLPEPPEAEHPFYTLPNCILTPHVAGSFGNEMYRMSEYMYNEFKNYTEGNHTNYEVSIKMLETMA